MTAVTREQPGRDHFGFRSYASKPRWNSYWHQLDEVLRLRPSRCLVVGGGDAIVPSILRSAGVMTTVVDVVEDLQPDVVADVRDLPFSDGQFDVILCCQVLEHIPFDTVPAALSELGRVASDKLIISLPDHHRLITLSARLGRRRELLKRIQLRSRKYWEYDGKHHWEVGTRNYPRNDVIRLFSRFTIEREYLVRENDYHRFFVLKPRD